LGTLYGLRSRQQAFFRTPELFEQRPGASRRYQASEDFDAPCLAQRPEPLESGYTARGHGRDIPGAVLWLEAPSGARCGGGLPPPCGEHVSLPRIESAFSVWLARTDGFLARRWVQVLIFLAVLVLAWLWGPGTAHADGQAAPGCTAPPGSKA
jgi:hypothetical protein